MASRTVREPRAVIYCRISDDREGRELGVGRQEEDCRALASDLGLPVVAVKIDNDVGASTRTAKSKIRHEYADMIERVRAGEYTHIIAFNNSRLTRRVREFEDLIALFEETQKRFGQGVVILTVKSGNDDLSTADGRMVARIKASVDTAESERIAERVQRTMLQRASSGEPARQHRRPFGFMEDQITHHPVEAQLIRDAIKAITDGASITMIRKQWERDGVLTTDGLARWGWTPLHRVLFNERNIGKRAYKPRGEHADESEVFDAVWEPIVTQEEQAAALAMLEKRSRRTVFEGKWLLTGLVYCAICNEKLYGQRVDPDERSSYSCSSGKTPNHLAINARKLEKYITNEVYNYVFACAYRGVGSTNTTLLDWPKEAELRSLEESIEELMQAHASRTLPADIVFPQVRKLKEDVNLLTKEKIAFLADNVTSMDHVEDAWTRSAILGTEDSLWEQKQVAIRAEVDSIVISKAVSRGRATSEEGFLSRIELVWRKPHYEVEPLTAEELEYARTKVAEDPVIAARLWKLYSAEEAHPD